MMLPWQRLRVRIRYGTELEIELTERLRNGRTYAFALLLSHRQLATIATYSHNRRTQASMLHQLIGHLQGCVTRGIEDAGMEDWRVL